MSHESISLHPEGRKRRRQSVWVMRTFFVSLHVTVIAVGLICFKIIPSPFPKGTVPRPLAFLLAPEEAAQPVGAAAPAQAVALAPAPELGRAAPAPPGGPRSKPITKTKKALAKADKKAESADLKEATLVKSPSLGEQRGLPARNVPLTPREVLEAKGLSLDLTQGVYVLAGEKESLMKLNSLSITKDNYAEVVVQIEQVLVHQNQINQLEQELAFHRNEVTRLRNLLDALPLPINNFDRMNWADIKAQFDNEKLIVQQKELVVLQLVQTRIKGDAWRNLGVSVQRLESSFLEDAPSLRGLVDGVKSAYETLDQDGEVKEALTQINKVEKPAVLGPSRSFREIGHRIAKVETEFREFRAVHRPKTAQK